MSLKNFAKILRIVMQLKIFFRPEFHLKYYFLYTYKNLKTKFFKSHISKG